MHTSAPRGIAEGILTAAADHFRSRAERAQRDPEAYPCTIGEALEVAYRLMAPTPGHRAALWGDLRQLKIPAPTHLNVTGSSSDSWENLLASAVEAALYTELERRHSDIRALNATL